MDPITLSISLAIVSGVASGLTELGKDAIGDAYTAIKQRLLEKFGKSSNIPKTINSLEKDPKSTILKENLSTEIRKVGADRDIEILEMARSLIEVLNKAKGVSNINQHISGNYNAVSLNGGTAIVNVKKTKTQSLKKPKTDN